MLASGAKRDLDLDVAGSEALVLFTPAAADGGTLGARGVRLSEAPQGLTVLDPGGFDLGVAGPASATAAGAATWLAVFDDFTDPTRTLIRGRFVGSSSLPGTPNNPVPPPPDAGTTKRDAPDASISPRDASVAAGGAPSGSRIGRYSSSCTLSPNGATEPEPSWLGLAAASLVLLCRRQASPRRVRSRRSRV